MGLTKTSNSFGAGLYTESTRIKAPDGTYTFALNAMMGSREGDAATITNENSNAVCITLPEGEFSVIGATLMADNNEIVFYTDNEMSYIGLHDTRACTLTTLVKSSCLGFKTWRQISARNRIIKGCERIIYFTDRVTSYKSINIDNLDIYLNTDGGFTNVDDANNDVGGDGWNCVKFNHFLSFDYGCIDSANVINSGGTLKYGAHQFTFRYLDADLNPTNWHILSNPVFIYSESTDTFLDTIDGEAFSVTATANKSIDLSLINVDTDFKYVQLAVAESVNGLGTVSNVYQLELIPITGTTLSYNYSGFNQNIHTATTLAEITVPSIFVEAVEAHEQVDNRLFLANVKTFVEDWALLQRATLLTETKWFTYKDTEMDQINLNNSQNASKNPDILFLDKTVTRDEIYALGIVFVFNNSVESPVFSIPGRPANIDYAGLDITTAYTNPGDHMYRGGDGSLNLVGDWDTQLLTVVPDAMIDSTTGNNDVWIGQSEVAHIPLSEFTCPSAPSCTSPLTGLSVDIVFSGTNVNITLNGMSVGMEANIRVVRYSESLSQVFADSVMHFTSGSATQVYPTNSSGPNDFVGLVITITDGTCSYNTLTIVGIDGDTIDLSPTIDGNVIDYVTAKNANRLGCTIERWKVHNTAVITDTLPDNNHEGLMGYYQVPNLYPDTIDCNGLEVFDASGADYGNDPMWNLSGQPIRHHRIPDCALTATGDLANSEWEFVNDEFSRTTQLKKMGIKLDLTRVLTAINNVDPALFGRIQGYYLVYGERNDSNKTVIDKGFAWKLYKVRELFSGNPQFPPRPAVFEEQHYHLNDTFTDTGLVGFRTFGLDNTPVSIVPTGLNSMMINLYDNVVNGLDAIGLGPVGAPQSDLWQIYTEEEGEINEYVSPQVIYRNRIKTGNYCKVERMIRCRRNETIGTGQVEGACDTITDIYAGTNRDDRFHYNGFKDYVEYEYNASDGLFTGLPAEHGFQRKVLSGYVIPYNATTNVTVSKTGASYPFLSSDGRQQSAIFETQDFFSPAYRSTTPAAADISAMSMAARVPFNLTAVDNILPHGYTGIYVSMKNYRDVFTSIGDITYLRFEGCMRQITDTVPYIKGGDTFITQMRAIKTRAHRDGASFLPANQFAPYQGHAISFRGYVESDTLNTSLASSETPESHYATKYFSYDYFLRFAADSITENNTFNAEILLGDPANIDDIVTYGEYQFEYNPDFGKNNIENPAFPLDINYDYCNECEGKESSNIYYSDKSFASDKSDNYKIVRANSLLSIPSDSGIITNVFTEQDQLYTHTEKALWQVQIRPQEMTTNEGQVQIATGDIGSIPPKRIVSTVTGYAGSQDQFATIGTQYGTFFIDGKVGRVFLFGKGLNEISNQGMEQWFKDNGPLYFRDQFYRLTSALGTPVMFPNRDTADNTVVGYQSVYDPVMDRIIMHKKDYAILDTINFQGEQVLVDQVDGALYYSVIAPDYFQFSYWSDDLGDYVVIDFNNKDYFQNLSWTISYSLDVNVWLGWHSYQPNFMYSGRDTYYSFINTLDLSNRSVWRHMISGKYQEFYGVRYPHTIEVTENSEAIQEKLFHTIQYISDVFQYLPSASNFVRVENITYDSFEVYTGSQTTTQRDLVVKTPNSYIDVTLPTSQSIVDRTDDYWRVSRFRDEIVDYTIPHHTYGWDQLQAYFDAEGQGYIDKVVNPLAVDINKSVYQLARLRNKYASIRLNFLPEDDYKIVTEVVSVLINQSLR